MTHHGEARVDFDASRCDGYGMCTIVFPERISLDRWGFAQVDPEPVSGPSSMARARRAVECCPRRALSLTETPGAGGTQ